MRRHRVRLSPRAEEDFVEITTWIGERSVSGVGAWIDAYEEAERSIASAPLACARANEAAKLGRDLRESTFAARSGNRYRILFLVLEDQIVVVRIRGAGQPILRSEDL